MRAFLLKFLDAVIAERVVITVILVNTLAMTLAGFFAEGDPTRALLDWIDYGCVVYFLIEALLKIYRQSWDGYLSSGWNRFDILVTIFCLPVLLHPFLPISNRLDWVPIVRAGRLFRLFRLMRFIPEIDHLVVGVRRALRASVGVFLALFLLNLIFALTASFLFGEVAPELFGNPARAFYSIFQIFTVEGWHEIPRALAPRLDGEIWLVAVRAFFMVTVLIGGVLGFSLANAVFIDEMTMDNTRGLERDVGELTSEVRALRAEIVDLREVLSARSEPDADQQAGDGAGEEEADRGP